LLQIASRDVNNTRTVARAGNSEVNCCPRGQLKVDDSWLARLAKPYVIVVDVYDHADAKFTGIATPPIEY